MNAAVVHQPQLDPTPQHGDWPVEDVRVQVLALLAALYPDGDLREKRRERRYPFPYPVRLTPVGEDGITPQGDTIVAAGKDLSPRGLAFYHPAPLADRRMIVSLESGNGCWLGFLIDLQWCRFTEQGWYESGGRFVRSVPSPVGSPE
jgi:hypothetical protein